MNTDALLHWLLRTSIEASVLILAVLGLRLLLGARLSPAWRIGLWMIVGMKLMLPAFIPAGFGLGGWFSAEAQEPRSTGMALAYSPDLPSAQQAQTPSPPTFEKKASGQPTQPRSVLPQTLLALWLAGAIAILAGALIRQRRFDSSLRHRPRADDPLLTSHLSHLSSLLGISSPEIILMPAGTTPAMVGIRQPKLLLPKDWQTRFDQRSLRHVLLHELIHVKQHDLLWNWAATAMQALHWFNPLVWFVVSRFQADRELRCDAGALAILSPTERLDYGHTLLRIQETFFAPPAIAGLAPCVRNHPTLHQRILMITRPTTRQPWLHVLLVPTLSVLIGYSFTTARAAEKEVPPKVREGETVKKAGASGESEKPVKKPATREREGGMKKTGDGEREGGKPSAERDGGTKKPGMRDGEGGVKKPGTRDGEKPRSSERDGMKKTGARDGEGRKPSAESGQKPRKGTEGSADTPVRNSGEVITMHVTANGDTVLINGEKHSTSGLRGHLSTFLPDHPGAKVIVSGDPDTPLKSLHEIVDAVRDNGNKNVGIKAE